MHSLWVRTATVLSSLILALSASAFAQFAPPVIYQTGAGPSGIAFQDFNFNSNNLDLAVTNQLSDSVSVLIGNGDGTFQPAVNYNVGIAPVAIVSFCSIPSGGFLNLAVANSGSNTVSVLVGNGDGTFQSDVEYGLGTGLNPQALTTADLNGDGFCDVAVATASGGSNNNGTLTILLGNGDGTLQPAVNYDTLGVQPSAIAQGFYLGVAPNLLVANYASNSMTVYMGDAQAVYTAVGDFPVGTGPKALIQVGHLYAADSGSNSIARVDYTGNGTFNHFVNFPAGGMPVSIGEGVLTKSGAAFLVVANEADSTLSAYREKFEKPYIGKPMTLPTCSSPRTVVTAPLRSNTIEDLLVVCSEGLGVMLNLQK